jgi:hypothetical protein
MTTITREQYLMGLGLFTLAVTKQAQVREAEEALNDLLSLEDGSHVSDAIYSQPDTFDAALKREGITVAAASIGSAQEEA